MELFSTLITDKKGRQIYIGVDEGDIVAEHNNFEIGRFEFVLTPDEKMLFKTCEVQKEYRRCGIGSNIMFMCEYLYKSFFIADQLLLEDTGFLRYCFENIFTLKHKYISDNEPQK